MENGKFVLVNNETANNSPSCAISDNGDNYVDRDARLLYLIIKEADKIRVVRTDVVIVSFMLPAMPVKEFFGPRLIENLAGILNVAQDKVRIVKVVAEDSGRRKRATGTIVEVEIGPQPATSKRVHIMKTCLYNFDPLKPHFI